MHSRIIGGGLKLVGFDMPVINSIFRQLLLFVAGSLIIAIDQQDKWVPLVAPDKITNIEPITSKQERNTALCFFSVEAGP